MLPWLMALSVGASAPLLRAHEKAPEKSPYVPEGYRLVWNDEFNGKALDTLKWQYRMLGKRENAVIAKEAVTLDGKGLLHLTTFKKDGTIHTGMIGTQGLFQQKYGYFEARIKFQGMQGHHGSFWLQSPTYGKVLDDPGKSGAEIDIIEYFGAGRKDRGAAVNIYWNPYKPKPVRAGPEKLDLDAILGKAAKPGERLKELSDAFHIYALLWTGKGYLFSIDGKEVYRTSAGLSHQPQYIVLSLLCSDWERKRLDDRKLPEAMVVDYVRVYTEGRK
jgi:beta-glucanase (GH16 family)